MPRFLLIATTLLGLCAGRGLAGEIEIIIESAQIKKTKANGKSWDINNGLPDPYVLVRIAVPGKKTGKEIARSAVQWDTLKPRWHKKVGPVNLGDELTLEVWDRDLAVDDFIGRYKFTVTLDLVKQGKLTLAFDQVEQLQLSLRSLNAVEQKPPELPEPARPKEPAARAPEQVPLTADRKERLKERDQYLAEAKRFGKDAKLTEALAAARKMLAIEREVLGNDSTDVVESLAWMASMHETQGDYASARKEREEVLASQKKRFGEQDWRTTDAALALAHTEQLARLKPEQRKQLAEADRLFLLWVGNIGAGKYEEATEAAQKSADLRKQALGEKHPQYATNLFALAITYDLHGEYGSAEPLYQQVLEIRRPLLGEKHPEYITTLNKAAVLYQAQGNYAKAEPLFLKALDIRKQILNEKHADYAISLSNLAVLYQAQGNYGKAEPLFRQALDILKQAVGEKNKNYEATLNNLALLYQAQGKYAEAKPLLQKSLEISKEIVGEKHPEYAVSLNNLAMLYRAQQDYDPAEPLLRQALDIYKQAPGEKHPTYATMLNNLALIYDARGNYARAEPLFRNALEIRKQVLGEKHPDYAGSLNNLALLYQAQGDYAKAEPLLQQALDIYKQVLGEKHPLYALTVSNLAFIYDRQGDHAKAEPLHQKSLDIRRQVLGEKHPDYAAGVNALATLYYAQGNSAKAEPLFQKALDITLTHLELTAAIQSERQQLLMADGLRYQLDWYVSLATTASLSPERLYTYVLAWKGSVFARQGHLRADLALLTNRRDPEVSRLYNEFQTVSKQLANLAFVTPDPARLDEWRKQFDQLSERKERLEADLSSRSAAFRKEKADARLTPAQLQAALPWDIVLIDFLEYAHVTPATRKTAQKVERRVAAFVVRAGQPIRLLDLGPVEPLRAAVENWRSGPSLKRTRPVVGATDPAVTLRERVWQPLEKYLAGASVVLLSPDGPLSQLPFAALPGKDADKYLIEEVGIGLVPVPQLIPELLAVRRESPDRDAALLLIGAVSFDAAPGKTEPDATTRSAVRSPSGERTKWKELPATREEVVAIKDTFGTRYRQGKVTELRGGDPTKAAVRAAMAGHRYLHLATHGYFAPPEVKSALDGGDERGRAVRGQHALVGHHPGLLSGLVLAGANRPPAVGQEDGILTALEVAELDLRGVDLAVLSACETGLGKETKGEGVLGLQRSFQVAGAGTVVASLWGVDDQATRTLMVRFYENLWNRSHSLGKLEALRQAQLEMLRDGFKRGMVRDDEGLDKTKRVPPYFWAAFTLSGDWR